MTTGSNGNFNMASEDFPALGGGASVPPGASGVPNGPPLNASSLLSGGSNSGAVSRASTNGNVGGLYGSELENAGASQLDGAGLLGGAGLGGLGGLRGLQQAGTGQGSSLSRTPSAAPSAGAIGNSAATGGGSGSAAGSALSGDYGLLGLLGVIRMTDADRNALALGSDLTMLGLNLGTTEQIYSTFSSPWNENVAAKEPHYQVVELAESIICVFVFAFTGRFMLTIIFFYNSFRCAITCNLQP
jgi:CCR4-NOT transcription complex subunit 2